MYIVAIGWLYVVLMMAITEHTVVAGVATFVFYGLFPVAILVYIMGTPGRRRRRKTEEARQAKSEPDPAAAGGPEATQPAQATGAGQARPPARD
ncbi:membrane protein [Burkholderiaceae bacterium 16]|nr:membrane protein [Burkholderiaceae bacterium 16]